MLIRLKVTLAQQSLSVQAQEGEARLTMAGEAGGFRILQTFYDEVEANFTIDYTASVTMKYLYVPFLASALYVALVFYGKSFMEKRKPLDLRLLLTLWNGTLALYSGLSLYNMSPPLLSDTFHKGFAYSVCNSAAKYNTWISFWAFIFVFSKLVELGDTFFVVARKTPLNFLHWYHHVTVLCYTWYALASRNEAGHWFCAMNCAVHAVMYFYYMLKSMRFRIPSRVALLITLLQLTQFIVGLVIIITGTYHYVLDLSCGMKQTHLTAGFVMYGSYFILFMNFFYHRYIKKVPQKEKKEE